MTEKKVSTLILKWSIGDFATASRTELNNSISIPFIRLAKTSVYSFQKHFPDAQFKICYNGHNLNEFISLWENNYPKLEKDVEFFDQRKHYVNPYPGFFPLDGVWWKWIPFRFDVNKTEIYIDSDIVCVNKPVSWYDWFDMSEELLVSAESITHMCLDVCGELYTHPILHNKTPLNCGIIGQKAGTDITEQFFELTKFVDYGTYNGNFIIEQGVFNVLFYQLNEQGILHHCLPYCTNLQVKDVPKVGVENRRFETLHFTAKSKEIFYSMTDLFLDKINDRISDEQLLKAVLDKGI